jgi:diguanylate cyclase
MKSSAHALQQQVESSRQEIERLQVDLLRARDEAVLDPLTRVLNRKGFDQQLAALLAQPLAPDCSHCLIMLDIDHFKKVNDTHGHVMGDRVIQALGEVLRSCVSDKAHFVARYGGEEFAILLPHCSLDFSVKLADTVRQRTKAMKIRDRRTQEVVLTVSISGGVAAMQPGDDAQVLIARADRALYKSKEAGRDRVTCG